MVPEASGRVKFEGNDRKNLLVIQQVQDGVNVEAGACDALTFSKVGMVSDNGTLSWIGNGTSSAYWQACACSACLCWSQVEPADTIGLWLIHPILVSLAAERQFSGLYSGLWQYAAPASSDALLATASEK